MAHLAPILLALLLTIWGCGGSPADAPSEEPPAEPRPNVVVVLADTLRAENLSVYGYRRDTSPNLAALADEGLLFESVTAQAPCTYPSVNSLLTGLDGTRFWIQEGVRIGIPEGLPSLAELLSAAGWTTVALSASPIVRKSPSKHNQHGGFDRGFDLFDEDCLWRDARCINRKTPRYLDRLRTPFFLYLHYMDPHGPFRPLVRRFSDGDYRGADAVVTGDVKKISDRLAEPGVVPGEVVDETDLEHLVSLYDDEIAFFDAALGDLVDQLRERGLLANTLIAVVADHGEQFLEHGYMRHCHTLFDVEIATPMVLRIPGVDGGRRFDAVVQNLDLVPTILDYLALEPPPELHGRSLRSLVELGEPAHEAVFAAYGALRSIATREHKLIADFARDEYQLYDRQSDPGELHDLAAELPDVALRLRRHLERRVRQVEQVASPQEALERGYEAIERLRKLGYVQ